MENWMHITAMTVPGPGDQDGLAGVLDAIDEAQRAGFDRAWLPQLPALAGVAAWDALQVIAVAGQRTTDIQFGTGVAIAYHQHPLTLARQALTANAAVGGRLTLGVGVSHPSMIEALGYSYQRPVQYLREFLEILIPALAGEPVDFHGTRLTAVGQLDLAGTPPPPVLIAALGPRMLDLAGSLTDGTVTTWTGPKTLEHNIIPRITAAAAAAGRPAPQVIAGLMVAVTTDVDAARESITATFDIANQVPAYRAVLDAEGVAGVADVCIVGDEQHVAAELQRFADIGVTEFVGSPHGDADTVRRTTALLSEFRAA
jgi:F420-dependent oxidoreductase-like protein